MKVYMCVCLFMRVENCFAWSDTRDWGGLCQGGDSSGEVVMAFRGSVMRAGEGLRDGRRGLQCGQMVNELRRAKMGCRKEGNGGVSVYRYKTN